MVDFSDLNPDIIHHVKPFRERKLGQIESFNLEMYKYIRLEYVLNMLDTKVFRFDNIKKWEDVYENFVDKEDVNLLNSKHTNLHRSVYYGQSWTTQEESDAMWRIYSDAKYSVRVMTVYPLLFSVLVEWITRHRDNTMTITIDRVFYADEDEINKWLLSNSPMNFWAYNELLSEGLFIKRREFEHEKEVRVVLRGSYKDEKDYIELDFDPNKVFREIVIDPRVSDDEFILQRDSLVAHGFDVNKIRKSTLYEFKKVKLDIDMSEPCEFPIEYYSQKEGKPLKESVFFNGPG